MASSRLFVPADDVPVSRVGLRTDGTFDNQTRVEAGLPSIPVVAEAVEEAVPTVEGLMAQYGATPRQAVVWQALIDGATKGLSRHRVGHEKLAGVCSCPTFYRYVKQAPPELTRLFPPAQARRPWTSEDQRQAEQLRAQGLSNEAIGKALGRSWSVIQQHLQEAPISRPKPLQPEPPQPAPPPLQQAAPEPDVITVALTPNQLSELLAAAEDRLMVSLDPEDLELVRRLRAASI
jgi:hypothetical protein